MRKLYSFSPKSRVRGSLARLRLGVSLMIGVCIFSQSATAQAQGIADENLISFVSCPIYRNTNAGRKSGCWLADDHSTGVRYDVTRYATKPDWNYGVLVEGKRSQTPNLDACGGVVMAPVRVSILQDMTCPAHILPPEKYNGVPYKSGPRRVSPIGAKKDIPADINTPKTFHIYFDYNSDFIIYQYGDFLVARALHWLRHSEPKAIKIIGYAATVPIDVSGKTFSEDPDIAAKRAERLRKALIGYGLNSDLFEVLTDTQPSSTLDEYNDGLMENSKRRVDIIAEF